MKRTHTFTPFSPGPVLRAIRLSPAPRPQHAVVRLVGCLRRVQTISVFVNVRENFRFSLLKGGYFYANRRWSILISIYVKKKKSVTRVSSHRLFLAFGFPAGFVFVLECFH